MLKSFETHPLRYFSVLILYCIGSLKGERTIYSIFHLLKGKKSSQTIQDAHLFGLGAFFGVFESITREHIENEIEFLKENLFIYETADAHKFILSECSSKLLENPETIKFIPKWLNGVKYLGKGKALWQKLSLLVQVCSHLSRKESAYIAIQKDRHVQAEIKQFLAGLGKNDRESLPEKLFVELSLALERDQSIIPEIFVLRLSGYKMAGLVPKQAAAELAMDEFHYHLEFLGILHYLCAAADADQSAFPILHRLANDGREAGMLTLTSRQTYKLLREGRGIEEICAARNLKRSTIEDHIVEIALKMDDFPISNYVSSEEERIIREIVTSTSSRQLRVLREKAGGMNYFKIRLVLAKIGEV